MQKMRGMKIQEIAVAVLIVGLILATAIVGFLDFRKNQRDARRMTDIAQIQKNLTDYFSEHRGYPATNDLYTAVQGLPVDPSGMAYGYESIDKESYVLGACLENARGASIQSYARADAENYEIRNSATACTCASINAYCINQDLQP